MRKDPNRGTPGERPRGLFNFLHLAGARISARADHSAFTGTRRRACERHTSGWLSPVYEATHSGRAMVPGPPDRPKWN